MAAGFVLAFAAGCGGGGTAGEPTATPGGHRLTAAPNGPPAAEECTKGPIDGAQEARMSAPHEWAPSDFTVAVGGSISWFNDDTAPHTVSFVNDPDCGFILGGQAASVTFNAPGVFGFVCRIYPDYLFGTVTVS